MELAIYRGRTVVERFKIDEQTKHTQRFYGENSIAASTYSRRALDLAIGDYIVYDGMKYFLNRLPDVDKKSGVDYTYSMTFESEYYDLAKVQYMLDGAGEFDYVSDVAGFLDLMVTNLNRGTSATWTRGLCSQTDTGTRLLSFANQSCREVIQTLCTEFTGELYFNGHELCFADEIGNPTGLTLSYYSGLRSLKRASSEEDIVTRLYPFGSEKNLPADYGTSKLVIAGATKYLEKNVATYGIIEGTLDFDEIYPRRTGTISSLGDTTAEFSDSSLDFDVNDQLLSGTTAKLSFLTGDLAGYTFDIHRYTHATFEFEIVPQEVSDGITWPDSTIKPAVGDTYVLLDIAMPASYVTAAETELETAAQAWLDKNAAPIVSYSAELDPRYLSANDIYLRAGDEVTLVDADLGVNKSIRVTEVTRQLLNPYEVQAVFSDLPIAAQSLRQYANETEINNAAVISRLGDIIKARRSRKDTEELKNTIFDPDGYFTDAIRPESVETRHLSVGAKSSNLVLQGVVMEPNYEGDASQFEASGGVLVHLDIAETITAWTLQSSSYTGLAAGTAYYIYARCHRTDTGNINNQIILDTTQRKTDSDATYYYFLVGMLHSVADSVRGISLTYGQTAINGKFITTGRIQSADGNNYLDLDDSIFHLGNTTAYVDYDGSALTVRGSLNADDLTAGTIMGRTIMTSDDAGRIQLDTDGLLIQNIGGTPIFTASLLTGDVVMGNKGANKYAEWNNSESTFVVRGSLNADDITAGTLTGRTIQTSASANTGIKMDTSALIGYGGGAEKFRLDATTGAITATSGTVGGWTLGANSFTANGGIVGLSSAITTGNDIRFFAGSTTLTSAPFRVAEDGSLTATSATIQGTIQTAASGKRVVIDSGNNTLRLYDSDGNIIIRIDEKIDGVNNGMELNSGIISTITIDEINDAGALMFPSHFRVWDTINDVTRRAIVQPSMILLEDYVHIIQDTGIWLASGLTVDGVDVSDHTHTGATGMGPKISSASISDGVSTSFVIDGNTYTVTNGIITAVS